MEPPADHSFKAPGFKVRGQRPSLTAPVISTGRSTRLPTRVGLLVVAVLGLASCDPERVRDIVEAARGGNGNGGGTTGADGGTSMPPTTVPCVETVACIKGAVFDSSPKVCACVPTTTPPPPPPSCGPVCDIYCQYGHALDAQGCETCACNPAPPPPPPTDPCATVKCAAGTHCVAVAPPCVPGAKTCPTQGMCVADAPKVTCGGIAGIACPGSGKCVDDPSDMCDPTAGGADCGGICTCIENVLCVKGSTFDSSPKVCACVSNPPPPPPACGPVCLIYCQYGNVLDSAGCPTCGCNPAPPPPPPPPSDPCAAVRCAAGTHCQAIAAPCAAGTKVCPVQAMCIADAPKVTCGGFAGIACPGSGTCVDDPGDMCDPKAGGADCGGLCQCVQNVACVKGATFDSSPKICACVTPTPPPPPPTCGPVCAIACTWGNVKDAKGCPTCACNPPPKT